MSAPQTRCMTSKLPEHPGEIVRREVLELLDLKVGEAAGAIGITRTALSAFLNAKASLSPDMAIRLEKAFGLEMHRMMHLQTDWDIAQARKRAGDIVVLPYRPGQQPKRQGHLF